jgi:hypothetical protein
MRKTLGGTLRKTTVFELIYVGEFEPFEHPSSIGIEKVLLDFLCADRITVINFRKTLQC